MRARVALYKDPRAAAEAAAAGARAGSEMGESDEVRRAGRGLFFFPPFSHPCGSKSRASLRCVYACDCCKPPALLASLASCTSAQAHPLALHTEERPAAGLLAQEEKEERAKERALPFSSSAPQDDVPEVPLEELLDDLAAMTLGEEEEEEGGEGRGPADAGDHMAE